MLAQSPTPSSPGLPVSRTCRNNTFYLPLQHSANRVLQGVWVPLVRGYEELRKAGELLAEVEGSGLEVEEMLKAARLVVRHASMAVAYAYSEEVRGPRSGVLRAMERMPRRLWAEALRLLEILREVYSEDREDYVELAREALEIAAGMLLSPR